MRHSFVFVAAALWAATSMPAAPAVNAAFARLPLAFEAAGGAGGYVARGDGFTLALTGGSADFALRGGSRVRMSMAGGAAPSGAGKSPLRSVSHYLTGADPKQWRTGVRHFERVRYPGVYPGIDVEYYGNHRQLEFDFLVAPGADPSAIRLAFEGAAGLRIDGAGDLLIGTAAGELRQHRPRAYQTTASGRREVAARWVRQGRSRAAFRLGAYDPALPLVIDPAVNFASYLGGSQADAATAVAVDAEGFVYVAGTTGSADFPGLAISNATGSQRVFLAKLHPSLSGPESLIFCTWFGGTGVDTPTSVAVDGRGVIYVTGHTTSPDFPTTPATSAQLYHGGGSDLFLIKLGVFGDNVVYSTLLGGTGNETGGGLVLGQDGWAYLSGGTASRDFPITADALQKAMSGPGDAVLARLDTAAVGKASLVYATFFGGGGDDASTSLALDGDGLVILGGNTQSLDFPRAGKSLGEYPGSASSFLSRIDLSGQSGPLVYSTYLGASGGRTEIRSVASDPAGNMVAAGWTDSPQFPTTASALRRTYGGATDGFLTRIDTGGALGYSTYLGGSGRDAAAAVASDGQGRLWVTGSTASASFPASTDAWLNFGGSQGFLTGIDTKVPGVAGLIYSTAIGGSGDDEGSALCLDRAGNPYVAGRTASRDFPAGGRRFQDAQQGEGDAFFALFEFIPIPLPQSIPTGRTQLGGGGGGGAVARPTFTGAGIVNAASQAGGAVAPGEIVRIGGFNLGPDTAVGSALDATGKVATTVAGVTVTFDGVPAPLLSVSALEVLAIVPYAVDGRITTAVAIQVNGSVSDAAIVPVAAAAPGIWAATLSNQDGSANSGGNAAAPGSTITFLATGEGQTNPAGVDGQLAGGTPPVPVLPVAVQIDGIDALVVSAAGAPGQPAGYLLVAVQVPAGVTASSLVPVVLQVGGVASQAGVALAVQ